MSRTPMAILGLLAILAGCEDPVIELAGLQPYVEADADGQVQRFGFSVEAATLDALGDVHAMAELQLPPEVGEQTYANHLHVLYEPHGHESTGLSDVPHLDLHFHSMAPELRDQIDCQGEPMPPPQRLPHDYAIKATGEMPWFGSCERRMGVHAVDVTAAGQNPDNRNAITTQLEYTYHQGELGSIMPLINLGILRAREPVDLEVFRPAELGHITRWPARFTGSFDEAAGTYLFTLSDLSLIE